MTSALRLVLGDQLSNRIAALRDIDLGRDMVLMVEVAAEADHVPHHPRKIALILSAMRHFADELRAAGVRVDYVRLDDPTNTGSFDGEIARAVRRHAPAQIVATEPGEWRVEEMMRSWSERLGLPVEVRDDDRFYCSRAAFRAWAGGRRQLRMEYFYREMRRRHDVLLDAEGQPVGGAWNYDRENRKPLPRAIVAPRPHGVPPDAITREVLDLVSARFGARFGSLEDFRFAVTRQEAERALARFIAEGLPLFGDYQDAMRAGDPFLFHSLLSIYLNIGLLDPRAVVGQALAAWRAGRAPLNSVEGFVRQILGWREFVRGIYWTFMPEYAARNGLAATRPLPALYWGQPTRMRCLSETIGQISREAYAHHIQRLMVTGNFALLIGAEPRQVCDWYLAVFADAFEWVELPNTLGMALHGDGGAMASKPYAAGGAYIDRMSDYCADCDYSVSARGGDGACPFNYLYWDFLIRNAAKLSANPRMAMAYRTLAKMDPERRRQIEQDAKRFLESLDSGTEANPARVEGHDQIAMDYGREHRDRSRRRASLR